MVADRRGIGCGQQATAHACHAPGSSSPRPAPRGAPADLAALLDPDHPEHDECRTWAGAHFDPERFNAANVRFQNPTKRLHAVYDFV
jgi:hypothetical protein